MAEEIEKLVEGTENVEENVKVDSSTLRKNDNQNDPDTRSTRHEHNFITKIIARRANGSIVSITESDYKNLNKNDIEDMYLLIVNHKVDDYVETGLLWSLSVFIKSTVIWERDNTFNGTYGDDVVDHTAKVLAILELIKIPNVDPNQLRLHVFLFLLTRIARKWRIDEVDGKITTWRELTEKFFHKYYPLSHTCKNTLISDDVDGGPDYLDFINWLNSKFRNHRRMDGKTKNALWEFWIKGGDDDVLMDEIVSSDDERQESNSTNHLNDNSD
ncbi:hypothetical protein Tco_0662171 [Tanacetum coccineum]